ncbi:MAG TPA: hypothetical protein DCY10_04010 [Clostridiales bacterium]|nr:hypothetical protein [Clostridiales bacterium]
MAMQGHTKKKIKIPTLIGSRQFQAGVSDFRAGKPLDASFVDCVRAVSGILVYEAYERGRQFAATIQADVPVKIGREVPLEVQIAYRDARQRGDVL